MSNNYVLNCITMYVAIDMIVKNNWRTYKQERFKENILNFF